MQEEELTAHGDYSLSSEFTRDEVVTFFANNLMHYSADVLSPRIADSILEKLQEFGMMRRTKGSSYSLNIAARGPDTVGTRFEEALMKGIARHGAEKRAVEKVLAQFAEQQPMLFHDL